MKVRVSIILGMILSFWSGVVYATTFTVTNNLNEGAGSLRWAVEQSNAEEGNSKIVFDLAAPSDTITLTELITVSSSVELEGTIAGGKVTIQGPEIGTLIHCVGVPTGGNFSLTSVNFGKWKSSTTTENNIAVMLDQIKEGGSANFSMNDVSVSGNAKSTTFVNAIDTAWFVSVDKCEIENVNIGIYYGNRTIIKNSVFRECYASMKSLSTLSRDYILVDGCEFYGGNRTTVGAKDATVINSRFDGARYALCFISSHSNLHVKSCVFLNSITHAIYSSDSADDWDVEIEDCEFYDNKRWVCYLTRSYTSDVIPTPSRVLFHHNYCGITKEGEPRPNGGGVWAQIDYVDIHDNVFATDGSFHMIKDEGNDTLYVRNNYFGTNEEGLKIGGERAIYSTYMEDYIMEILPKDRQEFKYYEDNVFYGIEDFGFKTDSLTSYVTLSRNLFIDMPDTAIIDVQKKQIPVISSAEVVEDKLIVTGVSGANSVVEIFRSSQAEQSALEYLTAVESDAEGAFTATIPIEKFGENPICLSATATYADRATSALSKVYCCEGCLLRLDRTEYYVKTSRQGKGDGSSWENAMDGKDFAFVLPQVGDGVTFYVAEGEYSPKCNSDGDFTSAGYALYSVKSSVKIVGGFSDSATMGAKADPKKNKTTFLSEAEDGNQRLFTQYDDEFKTLTLEGLYFYNCAWGVKWQNGDVEILKSNFDDSKIILGDANTVSIKSCQISNVTSPFEFNGSVNKIVIDDVETQKITSHFLYLYSSNRTFGDVLLSNIKSKNQIYINNCDSVSIVACSFVNDTLLTCVDVDANGVNLENTKISGFASAVAGYGRIENLYLKNDTLISNGKGSVVSCAYVTNLYAFDTKVYNGTYGFNFTTGWATIENCVVSGNSISGICAQSMNSLTLKNNVIGLDESLSKLYSNGVGLEVSGCSSLIIDNNVISGNLGDGFKLTCNPNLITVTNNYIGTNKKFQDCGNGGDGIFMRVVNGSPSINPSSYENANFIGFNKGNGISTANYDSEITHNYIGVSLLGDAMPNGKYGIYTQTGRGTGLNIVENHLGFNVDGDIKEALGVFASKNWFHGNTNNAIDVYSVENLPSTPKILSVEKLSDVILLTGTTDTNQVSDIELFYSNGVPQTAFDYLATTETDENGDF